MHLFPYWEHVGKRARQVQPPQHRGGETCATGPAKYAERGQVWGAGEGKWWIS